MNFIFDIGNVLVDFRPVFFLESLFTDKHVVDKMNKTIFQSREWIDMDLGIISHEQALEVFCGREPEYQAEIMLTMDRVTHMFTPYTDVIELLPKIKGAGYGLYYLSNMHNETRNFLIDEYDFFALFDGGVFSCDVNIIKPSSEIYHVFLAKYNLEAKNCMYFDDSVENIEAANEVGINGVLFTDVQSVQNKLRGFNIP